MNKSHQSDLQTQVYFIKPDDFHDILNVFQDFNKFQRTRAMRRRAYVRYIEEEMEKQIREYDSRFDRYGGGGSMQTS